MSSVMQQCLGLGLLLSVACGGTQPASTFLAVLPPPRVEQDSMQPLPSPRPQLDSRNELIIGDPELLHETNLYLSAVVNAVGDLDIVTVDGRHVLPKRQPEQTAFRDVKISADRRAIGWLNEYYNGVPLQLVVYSRGFVRTFAGPFGILVAWSFEADARQVALRSMFPHTFDVEDDRVCDTRTGEVIAHVQDHQDKAREARTLWRADLGAEQVRSHS